MFEANVCGEIFIDAGALSIFFSSATTKYEQLQTKWNWFQITIFYINVFYTTKPLTATKFLMMVNIYSDKDWQNDI